MSEENIKAPGERHPGSRGAPEGWLPQDREGLCWCPGGSACLDARCRGLEEKARKKIKLAADIPPLELPTVPNQAYFLPALSSVYI